MSRSNSVSRRGSFSDVRSSGAGSNGSMGGNSQLIKVLKSSVIRKHKNKNFKAKS